MALNLIVLGPPGAGKGTQAEGFARSRGIPKISTGDILREAVAAGTEIGKHAKAIMDRGALVSDEVIIGIVRERLGRADAMRGFVLDGFPRTVAQATSLDEIMHGRDPLIVVDIAVPDAELMRRMLSRLICEDCGTTAGGFEAGSGGAADTVVLPAAQATPPIAEAVRAAPAHDRCRRCGGRLVQRADDNEATVVGRLKVYRRDTKPLIDYYRVRPTFRSINGAQPPDRVAADLVVAIDGAAGGVAAPQGVGR